MQDDLHQPVAVLRIFDARHCLHRAAQRGQRVLDFVSDVGGEMLDRVHPVPQRLRHVAQGQRQLADLVIAAAQVGDVDMPAFFLTDVFGGDRQLAQRPADHAGKINRQKYGDAERDQKHVQDVDPHFDHRRLDVVGVLCQHDGAHDLPRVPGRRGGRKE